MQKKILLIVVNSRTRNTTSNESRIFSNKFAHSGLTGKKSIPKPLSPGSDSYGQFHTIKNGSKCLCPSIWVRIYK